MRSLLVKLFLLALVFLLLVLALAGGSLYWLQTEPGERFLAQRATVAAGRGVHLRGLRLSWPDGFRLAHLEMGNEVRLEGLAGRLDWSASSSLGRPVLRELRGEALWVDLPAPGSAAGSPPAPPSSGDPTSAPTGEAPEPADARGVPAVTGSGTPAAPGAPTSPAAPGALVPGPRSEGPREPPVVLRDVHLGELHIRQEGLTTPFQARDLRASLDPTGSLHLEARGQLGADGALELGADLEQALAPRPRGQIQLTATAVPLSLVAGVAKLLGHSLPVALGGAVDGNLQADLGPEGTRVQALFLPREIEVAHPRLPIPLRIPRGRVQFTSERLDGQFDLELGELRARWKSSCVPPEPGGALDGTLTVEPFGFPELAPFLPEAQRSDLVSRARGQVRAEASLGGSPAAPEWNLHVEPKGLVLENPGLPPLAISGRGLHGDPSGARLDLALETGGLSLAARGGLVPLAVDGSLELDVVGEGMALTRVAGLLAPGDSKARALRGTLDLRAGYRGAVPRELASLLQGLDLSLATQGVSFPLPLPGEPRGELECRDLRWASGELRASPLLLRTPLGTTRLEVSGRPLDSGGKLEWRLGLEGLRPLRALPGAGSSAADPEKSRFSGTLAGALERQGEDWVLSLRPFRVEGPLVLASGPLALSLEASGGRVTPTSRSLEGIRLRAPGVSLEGRAEERGEKLSLDLSLGVELAKLPLPGAPPELVLAGALRGSLAYRGGRAALGDQVLRLRPEGVSLRHPSLPAPLGWERGDLEVRGANLRGEELVLTLGRDLQARLGLVLGDGRAKGTLEFQDWSLGELLSLAPPGSLPSGWVPRGALTGRVFYGGPIPAGKDPWEDALAVRLQSRGAGLQWTREGMEPADFTLGGSDLVLRGGKVDLRGVVLTTPLGEIQLKGELTPLGPDRGELAFYAPELRDFQALLPGSTRSEGKLLLDGRAQVPASGPQLSLRLRPRGLEIHRENQHLRLPTGSLEIEVSREGDAWSGSLAPQGLQLAFAQMVLPLVWERGGVHLRGQTLALEGLELGLGKGTRVQVAGQVVDLAGAQEFRQVVARGKISLPDIQPVFGLTSTRDLVGVVDLGARVTGRLTDFLVEGDLRAAEGLAIVFHSTTGGRDFPIPLEDVQVPFRFQGRELLLQGIAAKLYGGRVGAEARFDFQSSPLLFRQSWKLSGVDLARFVKDSAGMPGGLRGALDLDLVVDGRGPDVTQLSFRSENGGVRGFQVEAGVAGEYFGLEKYLHPAQRAKDEKKDWKKRLLGALIEKVVQEVDALSEMREHLKSLLRDHSYPDLAFRIGGPAGWFGLERFWIPQHPGLFEGRARIRLDTLDLDSELQKMNWSGDNDCRYFLEKVAIGGKVTAPKLEDMSFWQRIRRECGAPATSPSGSSAPATPSAPVATAPPVATRTPTASSLTAPAPLPPPAPTPTPAMPTPSAPSWGTR